MDVDAKTSSMSIPRSKEIDSPVAEQAPRVSSIVNCSLRALTWLFPIEISSGFC